MRWIPILVLTWIVFSCCISENEEDWPMFQHDPQHTGYSPHMPYPFEEKWVYKDIKDSAYCSVSDETLFVNQRYYFSAIDLIYGSLIWNFEPGKPGIPRIHITMYGYPAVSKNRIFISATEGILCLDALTGAEVWYHEVKYIEVFSSPIVVDDYVIVGSGGDFWNVEAVENAMRVLCLDAETGKKVWEFHMDDMADSSPAYFNGNIYVNSSSIIYCLTLATGELFWEKKLEWTTFSSLSLDGERIFAGVHNGVLCLDIETGDVLWHFDCGEMIFETPLIAHQKIFFGTPDGIFYCLDAKTGELIWDIETAKTITAIAVANNKVVFGNTKGRLYIVDAESGEIYESLQLDEYQIDSLILSGGKLICGQTGGTIYCFEELNTGITSFVPVFAVVGTVAVFLIVLKFLR